MIIKDYQWLLMMIDDDHLSKGCETYPCWLMISWRIVLIFICWCMEMLWHVHECKHSVWTCCWLTIIHFDDWQSYVINLRLNIMDSQRGAWKCTWNILQMSMSIEMNMDVWLICIKQIWLVHGKCMWHSHDYAQV